MTVPGRDQTHRHSCYLSDNLRFSGMRKLPGGATRERMRNQSQIRPAYFAPGARVTFPQFDEINRPIQLRTPSRSRNALAMAIDLYE